MYKVLKQQVQQKGEYRVVPIRYQDRLEIMKWRNEQIYHLRQTKPLTQTDQESYFEDVIRRLFDRDKPNQLLFSYLKGDECIGYGGLVHINWIDSNAEISFIMKTELEKKDFHTHWSIFLGMIEQVAFFDLKLHKLFTYAFDLRPHLYDVLESKGFDQEARLSEHCHFNNEFIDVVIHRKINPLNSIELRSVLEDDLMRVYDWSNDPLVRAQSFNSRFIELNQHKDWFKQKLASEDSLMLIGELDNSPFGLVRFSIDSSFALIGILIDSKYRGRGLATQLLIRACDYYFKEGGTLVHAYIKLENKASIKAFEGAGFILEKETEVEGIKSLLYVIRK